MAGKGPHMRHKSERYGRRGGFTLVELLVVIGIIALLISILLPVLGRARDQANRVACLSNIRQIGMGFRMYAGDNKDWCPFSAPLDLPNDLPEEYIHWRGGIKGAGITSSSIAKYLGGENSPETLEKIFRCPSDYTAPQRVKPRFAYSYSMNIYFDPRGPARYPAFAGPATRLSTTKNASEKVLLAEENEVTINDGFWVPGVGPNANPQSWVCEWDWLSIRHDGGMREFANKAPQSVPFAQLNNKSKKGVVVFADGHADVVPRDYAHHPHHVLPRF
jgi:prepilin-type N-terminal cleavage/methylation domain-containing protein